MSHHTIEFDQECKACTGSGLYKGMGERDGFAVVCHTCKGKGHHETVIEYDDFISLKRLGGVSGIKRIVQVNPGICLGTGNDGLTHESFGGMSYDDWLSGKPFVDGMENRDFTCPAWWYQSADSDRKPSWDECGFGGSFSGCKHFGTKGKCWERFDTESKGHDNG